MSTTPQPDGSLTHRFVEVDGLRIHSVEAGMSRGTDVLLVHGWPQDWAAFEPVLRRLGKEVRVAAIDLPGVGASEMLPPSFAKRVLARYVRGVVRALGLQRVMITGHDVGGQIAHAYVRVFPDDLSCAAIINVSVPSVEPWSAVVRHPAIWHFAFHAVPDLPERLVADHVGPYFDFFFDRGQRRCARASNGTAPSIRP